MAYMSKNVGLRSLAPIVDQTEQFLEQKNVPKEQVVPFLMSLGRPELAGAVADRMRLDQAAERMKSMQQGQSAPPTVAQENRMQAMQMGQMQPGPQPMAAGLQSVAPPPQGMAGGGIVAFARGGNEGLNLGPDFSKMGYGAARAQLTAMLREAEAAGQIERAAQLRMQLDKLEGGIRSPGHLSEGARRSMGMPVETPQPPVAPQPPPAAAPAASAPAGFIAPDSQGALFDAMMQSARRPDTSPAAPAAAPVISPSAPRSTSTATVTTRRARDISIDSVKEPDFAKPQTLEEAAKADRDALKAAGITGDATKAYEDFIKSREAAIPEEKKAAYKNAWMLAGARLLGSRSPFFAQALGEAAEAGITGYQKDLKEIKAAEQALKQTGMQIAMNKEAMARGDFRASQAEVRRQEELYGNRQLKLFELQSNAREKALDRATDLTVAKLRNVTGAEDRIAELRAMAKAVNEPGLTPQQKQQRQDAFAERLDQERRITASVTAGGYAADIRAQTAEAQLLENVRKRSDYQRIKLIADNPNRPEKERNDAKAQLDQMERDALGGGPRVVSPDYAPRSQNISGGPYSSMSDDEVRQKLNEQFGIR